MLSRCVRPIIGARVAADCGYRQPPQIVVPALFVMARSFSSGRPPWVSLTAFRPSRRDRSRSGGAWRYVLVAFPAEAIGQAMHRYDLRELAAGGMRVVHVEQVDAAGNRLDLAFVPIQRKILSGS